MFKNEHEFEDALINMLVEQKGWHGGVLNNPTEEDLLQNWADILFQNNRERDRLNNVPLNQDEMQQIINQINELKTPVQLNSFINGREVPIRRENEADRQNIGKTIYLRIYDRHEIAGGKSYYQIARQPQFRKKQTVRRDRRGDFILLINGMPVIHVELKRDNVPISQPIQQIREYMHEQAFTGIYSLVQIFVAMTPSETRYLANPGEAEKFNPDYYFQWADFDNEPENNWKDIAEHLLSIPMAHQLIGYYTIPNSASDTLMVMRSYQIYAAREIQDRVREKERLGWEAKSQLGGHIWHTTGSGKTITSFKSAQLIASTSEVDKVIFLMDRIELSTQTVNEFRSFAEFADEIQATDSTTDLVNKLKSKSNTEKLIVTSIQKMSRIKEDAQSDPELIKNINTELNIIRSKRLVFIVDEAHRSTFGEMLAIIKQTFPEALFFGFTGTPIQEKNIRKDSTTSTIFGDELHRYSIADGIRDGNVLGFDVYKVHTFSDSEIRQAVALQKSNSSTEQEAYSEPSKTNIFEKYMFEIPMATKLLPDGTHQLGIESYISMEQFGPEHRQIVVEDIVATFTRNSRNRKFHAIFATNSINEAIEYYRLMKKEAPNLNVTALFDPTNDHEETSIFKEDALVEVIEDYNRQFNQAFTISTHSLFKKDIALRLAHKNPYKQVDSSTQLDIVIVVQQLLTGYDSKWVNTLYLDKLLEYQNIIQAFSRTNRLNGPEKPFGTIRYYRKVNMMEQNIHEAIELYSGKQAKGLFVEKLHNNLEELNNIFEDIESVFITSGINNFSHLPEDSGAMNQFVKLFNQLNHYYESAMIQGFAWSNSTYEFKDYDSINVIITEEDFLILGQRYSEVERAVGEGDDSLAFDINYQLLEGNRNRINYEYLNTNFKKYMRVKDEHDPELIQSLLDDLHRTFAQLPVEFQSYAEMILNDLNNGELSIKDEWEFTDYLNEYQQSEEDEYTQSLVEATDLNEPLLREMLGLRLTETNIDEYSRFSRLKKSVNQPRLKSFIESELDESVNTIKVNMFIDRSLRDYVMEEPFDIKDYIQSYFDK